MTPTQRMQHWPWLLRDHVVVGALVLIVLGLMFSSMSTLQGVGGIVFGTGLTVLLSQLTNRQQAAKDSDLRRKTDFYGPLQAELQNLRERLEDTQNRAKPYLQQWDKNHPGAFNLNTSSPSLNDWFSRIQNARATPPSQPIEVTWAIWWLRAAP